MVYKLSYEEVLKVCNSCKQFVKDRDACKGDDGGEPKALKELHRCKKWDEHFGSSCIYQG